MTKFNRIIHFQERIDCAKSVTDICYLTHRLTHSDAKTRKILSKLFTLFHLLDTTFLDCRKAISFEIDDYEDAIMVEIAIRSEMDCIVTRNVKDYANSALAYKKLELKCFKGAGMQ